MKMINNMLFRKKLVVLITIISATLLVVTIDAVIRVAQIDKMLNQHMTVQIPKADALMQADRDLHRALVAERSIMFVDVGLKKYKDLVNQHKGSVANVRRRIDEYEQLAVSVEEAELLKKLHSLFDRWQTTTNEVVRQRSTDTRDGRRIAIDVSMTKAADEFAELREATAALANMAMRQGRVTAKESGRIVASARNFVVAFSAAGLSICVFLIVWAPRFVGKRLDQIVARTRDIAEGEGDLTRRLDDDAQDEIGQLASAFNRFSDKIHSVIRQVKEATSASTMSAQEIARGNADVSRRTEEQTACLEETASSMEEMTTTVKQNADNARKANQLANAAQEQAVKGGEIVTNTVAAVNDIQDSSKRIADIIGLIDEIAFQTNLLALNAAVEAARAGEQGRGFAVVAVEVRNLAQRSAAAAKEIKDLINDSVDKVKIGSDLVDECGKALADIVNSVKSVSNIVSDIAVASQQQSLGIEQVNKVVVEMDERTQQNAALVEEVTAASQSLEERMQALSSLVAFFKVDHSGGRNQWEDEGQMRQVEAAKLAQVRDISTAARKTDRQAPLRVTTRPHDVAKTGTEGGEWEEF